MSGQYPPPTNRRAVGSLQSAPSHEAPPWTHSVPQPQGLGLRGAMEGAHQGTGYYLAPLPSMMGAVRAAHGPPQQAHMSSAATSDRRSPLHLGAVSGAWQNLGMPLTKGPAHHPREMPSSQESKPSQLASLPESSGNTGISNSSSGSQGPSNPLFNLQMLVNQDVNRNAASVSSAVTTSVSATSLCVQSSSYSSQNSTAVASHETVDLSSSSEAHPKVQVSPIPLTRLEKQPEHSPGKNICKIASSTVSSTNISSATAPMNGEVSSNNAVECSNITGLSCTSEKYVSKKEYSTQKSVVECKSPMLMEPVSVIAQTPPKVKQKTSPVAQATVDSSSSPNSSSFNERKDEKSMYQSSVYDTRIGNCKSSLHSDSIHLPVSSAESHERTNPVIHSNMHEACQVSVESSSNVAVPVSCSSIVKQSEDSSPIPSPQSSMRDNTSPVTSQKCVSVKRSKKVDSILENLVECGTKKLVPNAPVAVASTGSVLEQPPQASISTQVQAPSVIVSPSMTIDDGNGCSQDVNVLSPSTSQHKTSPLEKSLLDREDNVSPTFSGSDDMENGKPRRKRKLDKPLRVSKTAGDNEVSMSSSVDTTDKTKVQDWETQRKVEVVSCTEPVVEEESEESIEAIAKDLKSSMISKPDFVRNEVSIKPNETDTNPEGDADTLLSVLVSENERTQELKTDSKNPFIEVETELEKMFAGIVESEESTQPLKEFSPSASVPMEESQSAKVLESLNTLSSTSEAKKGLKRGRPKGSRNSSRRSSDSIFGTSSVDSTPKKKKKKKQPKRYLEDGPCSSQGKKIKRPKILHSNYRDSPSFRRKHSGDLLASNSVQAAAFYDSGSNTSSSRSRGPVVHIEGPRDSPYSVTIINAPSRDDEDGNDKSSNKKQVATNSRRKNTVYHNDLEFRGKVSRAGGSATGLFSSTLSARYDSVTTDPTWICVFCKKGPHTKLGQGTLGNGDLFGPYLVGKEKSEDTTSGNPFTSIDPSADEKDITEAQKKGHKNKKSLRGAEMVEQFHQKMSKKLKRVQSDMPTRGMTPVAQGAGGRDEGCFEVWVHEACVAWAAGVYLVGSHVVGLQEAVWSSVHTTCSKCGEGGANVGCVRRACDWHVHYGCALDQGWDLNEDSYIARCHKHKSGSFASENILLT